jgi:hypothetical protein
MGMGVGMLRLCGEDRFALLTASLSMIRHTLLRGVLGFTGEVFADAEDGVALASVEGEEFETVAQALAVADDGADFDGIGRQGQGNFEGDDFAGFKAAGEGGPDAILAHFGRASPAGAEFSCLKHFDLQADVDDEAWEAPSKGDFGGWGVGGQTGAGSRVGSASGGGLSFFFFTHKSKVKSQKSKLKIQNGRVTTFLVAMQQVAGLEWQFAGEFDDCHAAVDGVNVDDANGAGDGCDFVDQVLIGVDDHDGGMTHASVIGGGDDVFGLGFGHFIDLFQKQLHFRGGGIAHDEGDGFAIGPAAGLAFADLGKIRDGDGGDGVGLVGDHGQIARGGERSADCEKQTKA